MAFVLRPSIRRHPGKGVWVKPEDEKFQSQAPPNVPSTPPIQTTYVVSGTVYDWLSGTNPIWLSDSLQSWISDGSSAWSSGEQHYFQVDVSNVGVATTNIDGAYVAIVAYGYSGSITPLPYSGAEFSPVVCRLNPTIANRPDNNFTASGTVS